MTTCLNLQTTPFGKLSFTTLIAFLLFEFSFTTQIIASIAILSITEILYRFTHIPNFDQPFVDQHNFGNYMDLILMNKINKGGWVLSLLCLSYYWIDTLGHKKGVNFFKIVGMNSLFIYLFFEIVGSRWFNGFIRKIASDFFSF